MYDYSQNIADMADSIENMFGAWGALVLILFQALQIVIAVLPGGFVEVAGGIIYGTLKGLVISSAGILSGSLLAFFIAKKLGRKLVISLAGREKFERYEALIKKKKFKGFIYLFFFLPGVPKDILIYVIGVASDYKTALIASLLRIPATVVTVHAGSIFGSGSLAEGAALYFGFIFIGILGLVIHNKILSDKKNPI